MILRVLDRPAQSGKIDWREYQCAVSGHQIIAVKTESFFNELVLALAIFQRHGRFDLRICFRRYPHLKSHFFLCHSHLLQKPACNSQTAP